MMVAQEQSKNWVGIVYMILGLWTISALDCLSKSLMESGFHIIAIMWMRYVINLVFVSITAVPWYQKTTGKKAYKTSSLTLQILRGIFFFFSVFLFYSMLNIMPVAEATTMNFCSPLLVLALSPFILNEAASKARWISVLIGFVGMLIVIRPGGDIPPMGIVYGFLSATAYAFFSILGRKLGTRDEPMVTLFYGVLTGAIVCSLIVPFFWLTHLPTLNHLIALCSTGVVGTVGHLLVNTAYKNAEASILMPFTYVQIISATFFGWICFNDFPDTMTLLGIFVICASGVGIAIYEYRKNSVPSPEQMAFTEDKKLDETTC